MSEAWSDKVVLVTGGSAGFGLQTVQAFLNAGATVVAVGRHADRLEAARETLGGAAERLETMVADITIQDHVEALFSRVGERCDRLDVLVNNVGKSARGRAIDTTPEQFQELWEINFLSLVRCTRAAAGLLRESGGSIVNIGSLASKSAKTYLGAYAASKFAVAAYSQQLRLELAEDGIHVMLVCPGPLAREDSDTRYRDQAADLPEGASSPGAGVSVDPIDPAWLAEQIVAGCEARWPELVVPYKARFLFAVSALSADWGDWLIRRNSRT